MKIPMPVMSILVTLFCLIPYLWFIYIGKIQSKKIIKQLMDALNEEKVSFNTKEQWNNNFIGIDESKNVLIFIKYINQKTSLLKINLDQIKNCQIKIKTRDFKKEKKRESELLSMDLELIMQLNTEPIVLNLYNNQEEFSEELELKRAEKWRNLILANSKTLYEYEKPIIMLSLPNNLLIKDIV